jgi:hypothetical protein
MWIMSIIVSNLGCPCLACHVVLDTSMVVKCSSDSISTHHFDLVYVGLLTKISVRCHLSFLLL